MKFVYHYADHKDLKDLYKRTLNAGMELPLKPFDAVKASQKLLRPIAVSDYLKDNSPLEPIDDAMKKEIYYKTIKETDFVPMITDTDICSTYNAKSMLDIFNEDSISEFQEIFGGRYQNRKLEMANKREYTFIIDSQSRREFPFNNDPISRDLARYNYKRIFKKIF